MCYILFLTSFCLIWTTTWFYDQRKYFPNIFTNDDILQILNEPITVPRGKEGVIRIQLTVPFGCYNTSGIVVNCKLTIEMKTPQSSNCDQIQGLDGCGIAIEKNNWREVYTLRVQHSDASVNYRKTLVHRVQLHTLSMESHPVWSDVTLREVQVRYRLDIFSINILLLRSIQEHLILWYFTDSHRR